MSDEPRASFPDVFRLTCLHCGLVVLAESLDRWGCSRCRGGLAVEPVEAPQLLRAFVMIRRHFGGPSEAPPGGVEVVMTQTHLSFLYRDLATPFAILREEFEAIGFLPYLRRAGEVRLCRIVPRPERKPMLLPRHLVLLAFTLFTTLSVGYASGLRLERAGEATSALVVALQYAAALFAILGGHEMGHFAVAKWTGTEASLPYFVPGPPPVGTFGAMISLRTPAPDRDSAILLGAAGPIVGFLVSIPVLWLGLRLSPVHALLPRDAGAPVWALGQPVLFHLLGAPAGLTTATIHPVAFAGWVGLLATTLNLLPLGQLDGGHIARSLLGPSGQRHLSIFVLGAMFVLGMGVWEGWFVWALLGLLLAFMGHPGALDEVRPLGARSLLVALVAIAVFALSATPVPYVEIR